MKITPLKIKLVTVQQTAFEMLLEEFLKHLQTGFKDVLVHLILAELLLKVKQKTILERQQFTLSLTPQQRVALFYCHHELLLPSNPLCLSVYVEIMRKNESHFPLKSLSLYL